MGYLDYAGLQYLWGKLKEKFAPKSHSHDDRYYTESEMDGKLSGKADNTRAGANDLINKLDSGTAAPVDDDLIITQWANHTTAAVANKNQYVRRPMSSIWNYIKGKTDGAYQPKGSYAASGHTHDDRYYTESEIDSKLSGKANSNHSHYSITTVADNRNTNTTPNDYRNTFIFQGLKDNSKINSPSSDSYSYLLGLRGWNDSSGGNSHELAFNNTGVYWRNGSTEWNGWNRIYADNYHPNADYATNAGSANSLSGLSSRSSQGWGVQTGIFVHGEGDSTGGDFAFRRDCPVAGQLSMVLDGRFYQNEGKYRVLDESDKDQFATAWHTHNYAGSSSAGGSANSAVKLDSSAGSNSQPVYFSGGKPVAIGYTIASSVPANAKFTDTTYGVATASSNGLMSSTDKTKLDDFSRVISFQKQIKLTTDWQDTGIAGNNLETGTYIIQVSGFNSSYTSLYDEIYSGIMTWYASETNSDNSSEIFLHNAGHADNSNAIYLRTSRRAYGNGGLHLQIACKVAATGIDTLTFKFRRLI